MRLFGHRLGPERRTRDFLRQRKWKRALAELEKAASADERDYAAWNAVGDTRFRCKSLQGAVEAWRRAADGYAREGLHENALALTTKILRTSPEETNLHLKLAEHYFAMGYVADSLASLRTYLRLCTPLSEPGLRAFFRKIVESDLRHSHLLEELVPLFRDTGVEDQELLTDLERFVTSHRKVAEEAEPLEKASYEEETPTETRPVHVGGGVEGLVTLDSEGDGAPPFEDEPTGAFVSAASESRAVHEPPRVAPSESPEDTGLPEGEGRDHYDLGVVYQEMKLWDPAISEFEQARRDSNFRFKADLAKAQCVMSRGNAERALELLESFEKSEEQPLEDRLRLELVKGEVHKMLGNLSQALAHFENVQGQQAMFENVEDKIQSLKKRMMEEGAS
jgi:tetratricopeptide (TPR) repeat protein